MCHFVDVYSYDTILESKEARLGRLREIVGNLSEGELNQQVYRNKRTIAEIVMHVVQIDTSPFIFWRMVFGILNMRTGIYRKIKSKDIFARDYRWNLTRGSPRNPRYISKDTLLRGLDKVERSLSMPKSALAAHLVSERHANSHLRQVEHLYGRLCGLMEIRYAKSIKMFPQVA